MVALCVDDEYLVLKKLKRGLEKSEYIEEVYGFDDEDEAILWAENNRVDIAFLDIKIHSMDGIELCRRLRMLHPKLIVVFCTGYIEHALEAFGVHANGYLVKPISTEKLLDEVEKLNTFYLERGTWLLLVDEYATLDIYSLKGEKLEFRRKRSKELFKILLAQNGRPLETNDIVRLLWMEDKDEYDDSRLAYLYTLISDLRKTLKDVGAEEVLMKEYDGYSVRSGLVKIIDNENDYYKYIKF